MRVNNKNIKKKPQNNSYTLVQLLVVIITLYIVMALSIVQYKSYSTKAVLSKVDSYLSASKKQTEYYLATNDKIPSAAIMRASISPPDLVVPIYYISSVDELPNSDKEAINDYFQDYIPGEASFIEQQLNATAGSSKILGIQKDEYSVSDDLLADRSIFGGTPTSYIIAYVDEDGTERVITLSNIHTMDCGNSENAYFDKSQNRCVCKDRNLFMNSLGICMPCPSGKFIIDGGCKSCSLVNAASCDPTTGDLVCSSGYRLDDTTIPASCVACPSGTFSSNGECQSCNLANAASCDPATGEPVCNPGYSLDNSTIPASCVVACPEPTPRWNSSSKQCEACAAGTNWNGSSCIACSEPTPRWNSSSKQCEACEAGTNWNDSSCIACSEPTPVWDSSSKQCGACEDGSYWNGSECVGCSSDEHWNSSSKRCEVCLLETPYWDGSNCVPCFSGYTQYRRICCPPLSSPDGTGYHVGNGCKCLTSVVFGDYRFDINKPVQESEHIHACAHPCGSGWIGLYDGTKNSDIVIQNRVDQVKTGGWYGYCTPANNCAWGCRVWGYYSSAEPTPDGKACLCK